MNKTMALALAIPTVLAGCAAVFDPNGAGSDYSCSDPNNAATTRDGVVCKTPFAVYKSTHGEPEIRESDLPIGVTMEDYRQGNQPARGAQKPGIPSAASALTYQEPGNMQGDYRAQFARPVRQPAEVMRIWIAPWIDAKDDLHFPSYVFTEIQARRWAFGAEGFRGNGVIVPTKQLQGVPGAAVAPNSKRAIPGGQSDPTQSMQSQSFATGATMPGLPGQSN